MPALLSRRFMFVLALAVTSFATSACRDKAAPMPALGPTPDSFRVAFVTTRGQFVVQVNRAWAPLGADRFYQLVSLQLFDDNAFFRVLPNFVAQFGASGDRKVNEQWDELKLRDDSVAMSNKRGTLSFASDGPDSRTHQAFINLKDNPNLDRLGFAPIGQVVEGMAVVDSIYDDYGDTPKYHLIATLGNSYLKRMFPKMDYIKTARVVPPTGASH